MDIKAFRELPLMGIFRGTKEEDPHPLVDAVISGGLKTLEITMNTPRATSLISKAKKRSNGELCLGAGTVLSPEDLLKALDAGAEFIVMPCMVESIVEKCVELKVPVFPGALTPHEVFAAHKAGAAMVKVFPSGVFGPGYIKELKGPFDKVDLMAVGGVRLENIAGYFSSGASAVAFGSSVFRKEWLDAGDFGAVRDLVAEYVQEVKRAVGT